MHDRESLCCGHYISDVFDSNTGIWCHCDDVNITEISHLPEGVILERVTKTKNIKESNFRLRKNIGSCLYQNKPHDIIQF